MKQSFKRTLAVVFGFGMACFSALAVVDCPPVPDPCVRPPNPTRTFFWTCPDTYTCGTAVCVTICAYAQAASCNSGNTGYVNVTFPFGNCIPPTPP